MSLAFSALPQQPRLSCCKVPTNAQQGWTSACSNSSPFCGFPNSHPQLPLVLATTILLATGSAVGNTPPPPTLVITMDITRLVWTAPTLPITCLITEMAFNHGYSLSCWQSSLQVLLEKKPGSIHVADLCALGLLEADFNASMKILVGHHMVHQALQYNLIPLECYGSVLALAAVLFKCPSVDANLWMFPASTINLWLLLQRMLHVAKTKFPIVQHC